MTDANRKNSIEQWTSVQAYTLAVVCLLIGIAGGWFVRGSKAPTASAQAEASVPAGMDSGAASQMSTAGQTPTPAEMQQMADRQAAPLLEKLKSDPNNSGLLSSIGNVYYDAQQFPTAIEYYEKALKSQPGNADVRTDMATAYWYTGNADAAIAEFNKALAYQPNKANALFNLGIVQWQGKMDIDRAVATWQKLLATNPNYEGKDKVLELIAQAKKHSGVKPGTPAKPLPQ